MFFLTFKVSLTYAEQIESEITTKAMNKVPKGPCCGNEYSKNTHNVAQQNFTAADEEPMEAGMTTKAMRGVVEGPCCGNEYSEQINTK